MTFPRTNNFDLIRLFAALQVFVYHTLNCFGLLNIYPIVPTILNQIPGVPIFFMISGFLITFSFNSNPNSLKLFFYKRALRIFPALWVCLIFTIILVNFFLKLDWTSKSIYVWILAQATFFQTFTLETFRNWGIGRPNGSLWSIVVELQFYLLLPFFCMLLNKLKNIKKINIALIFVFTVSYLFSHLIHAYINDTAHNRFNIFEHPRILLSMRILSTSVFWNIYYFIIGIFFYYNFKVLKQFIEKKFTIWLLIYLAYTTLIITTTKQYFSPDSDDIYSFIELILLSFLTFSAAFSFNNLSEKLLKHNDISYGIYIYHMPIINTIIALKLEGTISKVLISWIIVINLAILSWIFIEKKAMRIKAKL
jgi:peptidoglycan/LPS O-acetylase OafA/YrhL